MFAAVLAGITIAAAFSLLGALMVKVSMLTLALEAMTAVALIATLVAGLTLARSHFTQSGRLRTN